MARCIQTLHKLWVKHPINADNHTILLSTLYPHCFEQDVTKTHWRAAHTGRVHIYTHCAFLGRPVAHKVNNLSHTRQ